ncbi:MAG: methionyl-tRNA formyltransferase [bacterium]|nr:methionyl-tRNA formyltransferase [bacterium]
MIKTTFFGTFEFAAKILEAVANDSRFEIIQVVTQPDQPAGRGKTELREPPVKILAKKLGIPVTQPETLKDLKIEPVDVNILVEYGKLIPEQIYNAPKFGTINIHPSLLPKWRGATPLQSALLNGEITGGVSIMKIDSTLDHGPILGQKTFDIMPTEKFTELRDRVAPIAADFLLQILPDYIAGKNSPVPQDDSAATFCRELTRADGHINLQASTADIYNHFRAFYPWPGSYVFLDNKRIKLLELSPADHQITAGKIVFEKDKIFVGTRDGAIEILSLQMEGKQALVAKDFINGNQALDGAQLA